MSERIHALASQLFGKPTVAACDLQEIRNLASRYPYFAPAQFLLLEKLREENSPDYNAQLQKAVLYYHNPLEFEYFIHADRFYTDLDFDEQAVEKQQSNVEEGKEIHSIVPESQIESSFDIEHHDQDRPSEATGLVEMEESKWIEEEPIASWVKPEEHYGEEEREKEREGEREEELEREIEQVPVEETREPETLTADLQAEPDQETELRVREHQEGPSVIDSLNYHQISEPSIEETQPEEVPPSEIPSSQVEESASIQNNEGLQKFESTLPVRQDETAFESSEPNFKPQTSNLKLTPPDSSEPNFKPQTSAFGEPTADKLNYKLSPPPSEPLAFEPFHTVDYFASQGIKLSQEELPKDKFGKQLKSFTEWLKTMKRLPATQVAAGVDAQIEQKVEHMAEDSIHDPHVVTEAMAEVWIKQGNLGKALEVYQKLSLTNPSKTAYFAAKIEQLKRS
jgi:hypothetical protein